MNKNVQYVLLVLAFFSAANTAYIGSLLPKPVTFDGGYAWRFAACLMLLVAGFYFVGRD